MDIPYSSNKVSYSRVWVYGMILTAGFLFLYMKAILDLTSFWWHSYTYSYGFLIPLVSLYLVWIRRNRLSAITIRPCYGCGLIIFLSGLAMLITGQAGGILAIQGISLIVIIAGIVLILLGKEFLRVLRLPIAYLLFMIPVWDAITEQLHTPFQNFSAGIGVAILKLVGIPAYRQTIYIELPNITLEVARVCSGVNNLIAVVAVGIPLAHLALKRWTRKIALVLFAVAIAILFNGLRVALIGVIAYFGIGEVLHGPYHVLQAMSVSFAGFIVLFMGAWILSDSPAKEALNQRGMNVPPIDFNPLSLRERDRVRVGFLLTAGLLIAAGAYINFYTPHPVPLKKDLRLLPYEIGPWKGIEGRAEVEIFKTLKVDQDLTRIYRTADGREVNLYIGYYETQRQGKELINYESEALHHNAVETPVRLSSNQVIELNRVVRQEGGFPKTTLFWYELNGRIVTDRYRAKAYTVLDVLTRRRSNGAVILVSGGADQPESFIKDLIPVLHDYFP